MKIKLELDTLLSNYFVQIDFNISLVNTFYKGYIFWFKDRLSDCMRTNVV